MTNSKDKWLKTMIAKHGDITTVRQILAERGRAGGKLSPGNFKNDKERARILGAKGGQISKRTKAEQ